MLTTRTPMKRTGFKPRVLALGKPADREQRLAERAARAMACATPSPGNVSMARGLMHVATAPAVKENALRSETYRRLVAALPCAWCGIAGYSQHAHENAGKGARLKVDDRRAMPLCCARPGIEGCHTAFDQYRLVPGGRQAHIELGRAMAAQTRARLNDMGLWPQGIPQYQEGEAA